MISFRPKVTALVDSYEYITNNCYQHQLLNTLQERTDVRLITIAEIRSGAERPPSDRTISMLKQRTLFREAEAVARWHGDAPIYVYDQDPWEAFKDDSPFKGSYATISQRVNVAAYLNTSLWWSNFVSTRGFPSKFVRMWMLPRYCDYRPDWSQRKVNVGFCGTLHPHRRKFFDGLKLHGVEVTVLPAGPYHHYLETLSTIRIYTHSEEVDWVVDGVHYPANSMWIKDIEAAARGCYSVRDHEEESAAYRVGEGIYTVRTYPRGDVKSAADTIKEILSLDPEHAAADTRESVAEIWKDEGWANVLRAMDIS